MESFPQKFQISTHKNIFIHKSDPKKPTKIGKSSTKKANPNPKLITHKKTELAYNAINMNKLKTILREEHSFISW